MNTMNAPGQAPTTEERQAAQDNLTSLTSQAKKLTQLLTESRERFTAAYDAFCEAHKETFAAEKALETEHSGVIDTLKAAAMAYYLLTNEKQVVPGVAIRINSHWNFDQEQAIAWSKAHNDLGLEPPTINLRKMSAIATLYPIPGAERVNTIQVTLSKNL